VSRAARLQQYARVSAEKPAPAGGATRAEVAELAALARTLLARIQALEQQQAPLQELAA
jgi:outer membrane murein-binding lipoprotein Lpp